MRSLIPTIMDNFKCLTAITCDDLNKNDTNVSVDFIGACETLRKKLFKSMKIVKKLKEELKLTKSWRKKIKKEKELIVRLDESNKK